MQRRLFDVIPRYGTKTDLKNMSSLTMNSVVSKFGRGFGDDLLSTCISFAFILRREIAISLISSCKLLITGNNKIIFKRSIIF